MGHSSGELNWSAKYVDQESGALGRKVSFEIGYKAQIVSLCYGTIYL